MDSRPLQLPPSLDLDAVSAQGEIFSAKTRLHVLKCYETILFFAPHSILTRTIRARAVHFSDFLSGATFAAPLAHSNSTQENTNIFSNNTYSFLAPERAGLFFLLAFSAFASLFSVAGRRAPADRFFSCRVLETFHDDEILQDQLKVRSNRHPLFFSHASRSFWLVLGLPFGRCVLLLRPGALNFTL